MTCPFSMGAMETPMPTKGCRFETPWSQVREDADLVGHGQTVPVRELDEELPFALLDVLDGHLYLCHANDQL